jgi:hypothetical protein
MIGGNWAMVLAGLIIMVNFACMYSVGCPAWCLRPASCQANFSTRGEKLHLSNFNSGKQRLLEGRMLQLQQGNCMEHNADVTCTCAYAAHQAREGVHQAAHIQAVCRVVIRAFEGSSVDTHLSTVHDSIPASAWKRVRVKSMLGVQRDVPNSHTLTHEGCIM